MGNTKDNIVNKETPQLCRVQIENTHHYCISNFFRMKRYFEKLKKFKKVGLEWDSPYNFEMIKEIYYDHLVEIKKYAEESILEMEKK